ncbi:hypothetical protein SAMD00019534_032920 [Acytostelium subglobosum LB1]|uniref:hypothetical protein n=1 Tax=Acytostelium subglobosum LB1 TaxID=1410327 RepID=UPI0006450C09|nr:hypothetical protein SAMD00019534_032920 [Acytostelium subglobosum LB1]GAM20117.1 hypothetical protein SAMD00019534_032920 [Acytostelium subglobosum LB1]|eukprot:XP_012756879.1 hypothetical protein SAMD00019534_032920 [Acytostelium subglobosum LB1]
MIRSLLEANKYDRFTPRLMILYHQLKQLEMTYETLDQSSNDVTEQFRQLHELLVVEEHRIKSPINEEIKRTTEEINSITQEITHLNNLHKCFNKDGPNAPDLSNKVDNDQQNENDKDVVEDEDEDKDDEDEVDNDEDEAKVDKQGFFDIPQDNDDDDECVTPTNVFDEIVKLIKSIQSLVISDQDNNNAASDLAMENDQSIYITSDMDLLHAIKECDELEQIIKEAIEVNIKLIDGHDYHNHYFSLTANSCMLFNPDKSPISMYGYQSRTDIDHSTVYARNNVYIFGGTTEAHLNSYDRFSLPQERWYNALPFNGNVTGAHNMSACYDGDHYIYLFGGIIDAKAKIYSRDINRFEIETQEFSHFVSLPTPVHSAWVSFYNGKLLVVGGTTPEDKPLGTIMVLDIERLQWEIMCEGLDIGLKNSSCLVGNDIYILSCKKQTVFFKVSLENSLVRTLSNPSTRPLLIPLNKMFYDGTNIIFLNGKGANRRYCLDTQTWERISDNYRTDRYATDGGVCPIFD